MTASFCNAVRQTLVYIRFRVRSLTQTPSLLPLNFHFRFRWKKDPGEGFSVVLEDYDLKALLPHHPLPFFPSQIVHNPIMATQPLGEANEQLWSVPPHLRSSFRCLISHKQGRDFVPPSKFGLLDSKRVASNPHVQISLQPPSDIILTLKIVSLSLKLNLQFGNKHILWLLRPLSVKSKHITCKLLPLIGRYLT